MDDNKLDVILRRIAYERYIPSEKLVNRTKANIRGRRLLQAVVFLSLFTQLIALGLVLLLLASPNIQPTAKVFGLIGLFAYMGCMVVAVLAARIQVIWFFRKVERLLG